MQLRRGLRRPNHLAKAKGKILLLLALPLLQYVPNHMLPPPYSLPAIRHLCEPGCLIKMAEKARLGALGAGIKRGGAGEEEQGLPCQ